MRTEELTLDTEISNLVKTECSIFFTLIERYGKEVLFAQRVTELCNALPLWSISMNIKGIKDINEERFINGY